MTLRSDTVEVVIDPWRGGGILAFKWRGIDVFRPHNGGDSPLDLACFPLIPFCNRIAKGCISKRGQLRTLPAASRWGEPVHALHGTGWISPWATKRVETDLAVLTFSGDGVLWPWVFDAEQHFQMHKDGFTQSISITNRDDVAMPAGLGLHPYFSRAGATLETGATGYWATGPDRLPETHRSLKKEPRWFTKDWFDDCFTGCNDPVRLRWPTHQLAIHASQNLPFTHIYTPRGEDYFCMEPVSHIPNAVNSTLDSDETGIANLEPGQSMKIDCRFQLEEPS
ncbi:aldose 1-epimerase [Erythrobacter crassostreae]|uniref:Aldose 1-epimerase n=1 Tax=Erythrobacter crassostreae TaxID=2828328 RepID=A0A9X1JP48_9SPHN|nr:aldose 1-epimerase [Erythrobacter crassostrea]MBV7259057.1 aldose 1-epimerase [Erythrobacter crassostrea]